MGARAAQQHVRVRRASTFTLPCGWAALALGCFALAFIAALLPVDIGFHYSSDANYSSESPQYVKPVICKSKAYANAAVVQGAKELIIKYATAAGLSPAEFIATVAGTVTISTGMVTSSGGAIKMEGSIEDNLSNLVDAADYPEWSSLDSETQAAWGTKEDYDSAKFVSLLDGLGFSELSRQYYDSFDGSGGGGDFDPSSQNTETLQALGRIGQRWMMGLGNAFERVFTLVTDRDAIETYFGVEAPGYGFNAAGIDAWPSQFPTYVELGIGTVNYIGTSYRICIWKADKPVWVIAGRTHHVYEYWNYCCWMFSESPFMYNSGVTDTNGDPSAPSMVPSKNAAQRSYNGKTFYIGNAVYTAGDQIRYSSMPVNAANFNTDDTTRAIGIILTNGGPVKESHFEPDLEGYPEEQPNPDEKVYYPEQGVTNNNTWNNFVTPTEVKRPDNPYNPENQTSTDDWKDDTEANIVPLQGIHFEKLFPFCLSYDVKNLFTKVKQVTIPENDSGVYNIVSLPFVTEVLGPDSVFDLDLTWLHDLLLMVRPFIQILIGAGLIISLVWFWRGILTG